VRDLIYDKKRIEVFNYTGTAYIEGISEGYVRRYLRGERGYTFSYGS
jgi:hypothetical protein